jgi:phage tail-like protein
VRLGFARNGALDRDADTYHESGAVALGSLLPSVYQEYDENALRLTSALDAVLAPVWLAVDCYDAYLSPATTPEDAAAWLATWVGIDVDDNWRPEQLRRLLAEAFELARWRGTARGITALVEAYTGLRPVVEDTGGVTVSADPGTGFLGTDASAVVVRVAGAALDAVELDRLTALVRGAVPAHVTVRVERA